LLLEVSVKLRRKGALGRLNRDNRREMWLKEINDAIKFEQSYLRVKVKDKEFD
jgi:ASC-1-like (ASCH) protein